MPAAQQSEITHSNQVIRTGRKCTVCEHDSVKAIDSMLATATLSNRRIASQFGLSERAIRDHKANHTANRLKRAFERRERKADDLFMQRHEHLFSEALQYVEDAKGAVKMQRVTVETEDGKLQERYQAFRDVGAMAPALGAATALQRMLGDATGRFAVGNQASGVAVAVNVMIPMQLNNLQPATGESVTLDVTSVTSDVTSE